MQACLRISQAGLELPNLLEQSGVVTGTRNRVGSHQWVELKIQITEYREGEEDGQIYIDGEENKTK